MTEFYVTVSCPFRVNRTLSFRNINGTLPIEIDIEDVRKKLDLERIASVITLLEQKLQTDLNVTS